MALLRVMPGVTATTDNAALGDTFGTATPNISGTRNRMNTFTLDGQTGSDADLVDRFNGATSMDAISEVKVLLDNYQAEYGRNAGAFVNIVSKSGTREFHGSGYWFKRHEQFNANDFFNNLLAPAQTAVSLQHIRWHDRRPRIRPQDVQREQGQVVLLLFARRLAD